MTTKIVEVPLPNGLCAKLQFTKTDLGNWICLVPEQSMIDLDALLKGEPLKQEFVKPWFGDIL